MTAGANPSFHRIRKHYFADNSSATYTPSEDC
jgi:hypothetical protein